jgi:hypothetical protein
MLHFIKTEILPSAALQVPRRSVPECLVRFITSAIESAYSAACRAHACTIACITAIVGGKGNCKPPNTSIL